MSDVRAALVAIGVAADDAAALAAALAAGHAGALDRDETIANRREELVLQIALVTVRDFHRFATALRVMIGWLESATAELATYDVGRFWHLRGFLAWRLDDSSFVATRALNRAAAVLVEDGSPRADRYRARVHDTFGQMLANQGLLGEARAELEHALDLRDESSDPQGLAITLGNLGRLCLDLGDYPAAVRYLGNDLTIVERTTPPGDPLRTQLNSHLGTACLRAGELARATALFEASRVLARDAADAVGEAFAELGLAQVALRASPADPEGVLATCARVLAQVEAPAFDRARARLVATALRCRAEAWQRLGETTRAIDAYRAALRGLDQGSALIEYAEVLHGLSSTLAAAGERGEATARLREALVRLDDSAAGTLRGTIERELRATDRDAWFAHAAGRFVGQRNSGVLEQAGLDGFRGERARRTILFSDLRGFTTLSERLAPEQLILLLNDYLALMTRCVTKHGGTVDKFIGDAVMAVFQDEHAEAQAIATAIAMCDELVRFNRGRKVARDAVLSVGIGVHAGEVVAGLIGSASKREYTVIGDTVNTASRLESMTKQLGASVLASSIVIAAIDRARYLVRPLGIYAPKGRRAGVAVFDVMGERDRTPASHAIAAEIERVETALALFAAREFAEAAVRFAALEHAASGPRVAGYTLLAAKARELVARPPDPEWAGEIVLVEK